jgi:phosphocarrier protein
MIVQQFLVKRINGISSKIYTEIVSIANKFSSSITLEKVSSHENANLKSVINTLSLIVKEGEIIALEVSGEDEKEAVDKISQILNSSNILAI